MIGRCVISLCGVLAGLASAQSTLQPAVRGPGGEVLPFRMYLLDVDGKAVRPPDVPFWEGGFVSDGRSGLAIHEGTYRYVIERGPEWSVASGVLEVEGGTATVTAGLERIADLKAEGWFGGDLHVHRLPEEMPLHLAAEDLSIASVQTWWNERNRWGDARPERVVEEFPGRRFCHVLSGEDERGGGALLYHRLAREIDITGSEREWPPSVKFLREAEARGAWIEIEKPFWWDTPVWLATGAIDSIGIAQNHMQRGGMHENEAWGRPRDRAAFPSVRGNGFYTQDLYYRILNCGFRIPPSAGSASGVLKNPVGYNRVYVKVDGALDWEKWWDGLRAGRCFVTNGPLLRVTANGKDPGAVLERPDGPLRVRIEGRLDGRDPIEAVELVRNGKIEEIRLPAEFEMDASGWFLVRAIADVEETFRFASTGPWYVEVGGGAMAPDPEDVRFFRQWLRQRRAWVKNALKDEAKERESLVPQDEAAAFWMKLAGSSD